MKRAKKTNNHPEEKENIKRKEQEQEEEEKTNPRQRFLWPFLYSWFEQKRKIFSVAKVPLMGIAISLLPCCC